MDSQIMSLLLSHSHDRILGFRKSKLFFELRLLITPFGIFKLFSLSFNGLVSVLVNKGMLQGVYSHLFI